MTTSEKEEGEQVTRLRRQRANWWPRGRGRKLTGDKAEKEGKLTGGKAEKAES